MWKYPTLGPELGLFSRPTAVWRGWAARLACCTVVVVVCVVLLCVQCCSVCSVVVCVVLLCVYCCSVCTVVVCVVLLCSSSRVQTACQCSVVCSVQCSVVQCSVLMRCSVVCSVDVQCVDVQCSVQCCVSSGQLQLAAGALAKAMVASVSLQLELISPFSLLATRQQPLPAGSALWTGGEPAGGRQSSRQEDQAGHETHSSTYAHLSKL